MFLQSCLVLMRNSSLAFVVEALPLWPDLQGPAKPSTSVFAFMGLPLGSGLGLRPIEFRFERSFNWILSDCLNETPTLKFLGMELQSDFVDFPSRI